MGSRGCSYISAVYGAGEDLWVIKNGVGADERWVGDGEENVWSSRLMMHDQKMTCRYTSRLLYAHQKHENYYY